MLKDNKNIDSFFKDSLHNYEAEASDILWDRLEKGLSELENPQKKYNDIKTVFFAKKNIKYLYFTVSAAAVLLIAFTAGNKFFNFEFFNYLQKSKHLTTNTTQINDSITNNNINFYYGFNIYTANSNINISSNFYLTAENDDTIKTQILKFPFIKFNNNINKNDIYIAQINTNSELNKPFKNNYQDNNKQKRDNYNSDLIANNNYSAIQEHYDNNISNINYSGGSGSYTNNNITQSNMEQQLDLAINKIIKNNIKDSLLIINTEEAAKEREEVKTLHRNNLLMKETFGIDTTNNQEIQELIINESKPTQALVFPNVFTPNNDGINDYFTILGIDECSLNQLVISDRFGKTIFETINYNNDWDARNIADGVYYFVFVCKTYTGDIVKKGMITVIR